MAKDDYSKFQQGVIQRYYENLDGIMLGKLQELVTELYLAKNGSAEDKLWERVEKAMVKLKIPAKIRANILARRRVEFLARNLEEWLKRAKN